MVGQGLENWLDGSGIARVPVRRDVLATFTLAFLGAFLALGFSGIFRSVLGGVVYIGIAVAGRHRLAGVGAARLHR